MAKQNSSSQLVRSDLRLMGLGLFSTVLLLGVIGVFNLNILNLTPKSSRVAERTIRIEEQPSEFGSQIQKIEDSYAAEEYMMEKPYESSQSGEMYYNNRYSQY